MYIPQDTRMASVGQGVSLVSSFILHRKKGQYNFQAKFKAHKHTPKHNNTNRRIHNCTFNVFPSQVIVKKV